MNLATATDLALEEEVQSTSESETLEADMSSLSNLLSDCLRSTDCFLSDPINRGKAGRFRISPITIGLLALNATLTLILNMSMLYAGATLVQLLICNAGMMIMHLLASICIASDLARGKTHFLNERKHLSHQFNELSEQMADMLRERQKWVDALNRCKWSMDAECLKVQLAEQELQKVEDKLLAAKTLLAEKQHQLDTLTSLQTAATTELQNTVKARESALAESKKLRTEIDELKSKIAELNDQTQETEASKALKENELARIDEDLQAMVIKRKENEDQLANLQLELESATASLAAQQAQQLETLAGFDSRLAELKLAQTTTENSITASQNTYDDLQNTITQSQAQIDTMRAKHDQAVAQQEAAIATNEATLLAMQNAIDGTQVTLDALLDSLKSVEEDLDQAQETLNELHSKAEYAQNCNVQLVNESIGLELKRNQHRESLAKIEAELEQAQRQLAERRATLDAMHAEEVQLEKRIESLSSVEVAQTALESIAIAKELLEEEVASNRQTLQELNNKTDLTQQNNAQLLIESTSLEIKAIQHRESVAKIESDLEVLQDQRAAMSSNLDTMRAEELRLEMRISNLLTQASKLTCLAVATSETQSYAQEVQQSEQATLVAELQDQKTSLERSLQEIQSQIESERASEELVVAEAAKKQLDAAKSISDAERRVELLTEKSESLAEQVQQRSAELFAFKQELVELRVEARDLAASNLELKEVEVELEGLKAQLADHRSQIASATAQIEQCDAMYQTRQIESEAIAKQIQSLEERLQVAMTEYQSRSQTLEQLALEHDSAVAQNQDLAEQKEDMEFAIQNASQTKREIDFQLSELREQARALSEQISVLNAERTKIESDVSDLTTKVQLLLAQRRQVESEVEQIHELAEQRTALEEEIANLTGTIDSLSQQQSSALEMIALHEQSLQEAELQLNTVRHELADLEQKQSDTLELHSRSMQELENTEQLRQSASEQYATALRQTGDLQKLIGELQSQLEATKISQIDASAALQQVIDEVNDAQSVAKQWANYIDSLKLEFESQRKTLTDLQHSIDSLLQSESQAMIDMERATNEVESLLEQHSNLRASNQAEAVTLRAAQLAIDEATQQQSALQHQLNDTQEMLSMLSVQVSEAHVELHNAEEALSSAINSQATLDNQILNRQASLDRIAADHEIQLSHARELADEQEFLRASLTELNKQISASEATVDTLESRAHQLEQELQKQQASKEIAIEQQASIESELAKLKSDIAELELTKLELAKIESACIERTQTLNALCEESALEQTRLEDCREQVATTQRSIDELIGQRACSEAQRALIEQETHAMKLALVQADQALQDKINAKVEMANRIAEANKELLKLTEGKESVHAEILQLSKQLNLKTSELQKTEDKVSTAETQALELWSTITELKALTVELDKTLTSKRDAVDQANAEMIKFDQIRQAILAQQESTENTLAAVTLQIKECQHSKSNLDQEIQVLTAEVEKLQAKIAIANEELALISQKIEDATTTEIVTDPNVAVQNRTEANAAKTEIAEVIASEEMISTRELVEVHESVDTVIPTSQEEDIWTSLGEMARLGETARYEQVGLNELPPPKLSKQIEAIAHVEKSSLDEWETILAPVINHRRFQ